jgi:hypothetical protein
MNDRYDRRPDGPPPTGTFWGHASTTDTEPDATQQASAGELLVVRFREPKPGMEPGATRNWGEWSACWPTCWHRD